MSTTSHLGVCSVGSVGVAVGGGGLLGLGCLRRLSVGAGLLLSLWWRVEGGHGDQRVALVLLVHWLGLLSLQVQHGFKPQVEKAGNNEARVQKSDFQSQSDCSD